MELVKRLNWQLLINRTLTINKQIERLERRRRQLLADYRLINIKGKNCPRRSPREIDDAEIISVLEEGGADAGQASPQL